MSADDAAVRVGARFFDARKRDKGCATGVACRPPGLTTLTVIDVVGASSELASFLTSLDKAELVMRHPQTGATLFEFRWASGYADGASVRIQGVLAGR
jgi:hypothetical protein